MAVVKMNKITVLGLIDERTSLLESLMGLGVVEISQEEPSENISDKAYKPQVHTELTKIEGIQSELSRSIDILNRYVPVKKQMFSARRIVSEVDYTEIMKKKDDVLYNVNCIIRNEEEISKIMGEENRNRGLLASLDPWLELDIPLDIASTRNTFCLTGSLSGKTDLVEVEEALNKSCPESILVRGKSNREHHYVAIIAHNACEAEVLALLREWGWNRITLRDVDGTARTSKERFEKKLAGLKEKREEKVASIKELASERERLEIVSDGFRMEHSRIEAKSRMVSTRSVFLLRGYLPAELSDKVKKYLDKHFFCSIEILEPAKDEAFPVLIENGPIVESISPVINMYGVPSSGEIDPSPFVMPFFIFFFGIMLGDGGYGIILALATGIILLKFRLEDSTRRFMKLIFFCGLSTIVAGFLTGGWFGIESLSKTALWLVPTENPELMMSWAMLFGIIHMYVGLSLKGFNLIRRGLILDAVFDVFFVYILFTGFIFTLLPFAPGIDTSNLGGLIKTGNVLLIVGIILMFLTQGRKSKNIFGKIFGGLPKLYDLISFFSDILSYIRLMALGLASGIIGGIVNTMSMSFGGNIIVTVIGGGLILIIGHTINIGLNVLGAYVHSCRLQYLEFFGKFFESGGESFKPFQANTQYITIRSEKFKFLRSGANSGVV